MVFDLVDFEGVVGGVMRGGEEVVDLEVLPLDLVVGLDLCVVGVAETVLVGVLFGERVEAVLPLLGEAVVAMEVDGGLIEAREFEGVVLDGRLGGLSPGVEDGEFGLAVEGRRSTLASLQKKMLVRLLAGMSVAYSWS